MTMIRLVGSGETCVRTHTRADEGDKSTVAHHGTRYPQHEMFATEQSETSMCDVQAEVLSQHGNA